MTCPAARCNAGSRSCNGTFAPTFALGPARTHSRDQHVRGPRPRPDRRARRPSPRRRRAAPGSSSSTSRNCDVARVVAPPSVEVVNGDASDTTRVRGRGPGRARARMRRIRQHLRRATSVETIETLPSLCAPNATVIWTRHRRAARPHHRRAQVVRRRGLQRGHVRRPRRIRVRRRREPPRPRPRALHTRREDVRLLRLRPEPGAKQDPEPASRQPPRRRFQRRRRFES